MTTWLIANQGAIGGGEVMLLRLAETLRDLGHDIVVVGPSFPVELITSAQHQGFQTRAIPADTRGTYARGLRALTIGRSDLLWCNGLLPAVALAGRARRVVHLHQLPQSPAQRALLQGALVRSLGTIVPSRAMAQALDRPVAVLPNWSPAISLPTPAARHHQPTLGFLGRTSRAKGIDVLLDATAHLREGAHPGAGLVVFGDARFVAPGEATETTARLEAHKDWVACHGWASAPQAFAAMDLAVFPSVTFESFGLVVLEAMSSRTPFVISDAGALPEVAGPDFSYVARAGDPRSLAATIERALSDTETAHLDANYLRWQSHYSPEAGREHVRALLDEGGLA